MLCLNYNGHGIALISHSQTACGGVGFGAMLPNVDRRLGTGLPVVL